MNIYLVEAWFADYTFSGAEIIAAFSDKEAAISYAKSEPRDNYGSGISVYEIELDNPKSEPVELEIDWWPDWQIGGRVKIIDQGSLKSQVLGSTGTIVEKMAARSSLEVRVLLENYKQKLKFNSNQLELIKEP